MMTRYFTNEFMSVDDFLNITSSTALLDNTLDGKVITLYSFSRIKQEAVKQHLLELAEKRLVLYSQMLGRGLRGPLMGGNEECDLIDIDDNLQAFDNETAFSHFNDYWRV